MWNLLRLGKGAHFMPFQTGMQAARQIAKADTIAA
jgi:hypothetical protein